MDYKWDVIHEDGREVIYEWSKKRQKRINSELQTLYSGFMVYTFDLVLIKSFLQNFNFMVILQMTLAAIAVYVFKYFDISFNVHVGLFVSPIVFPLAFSINTDFQRREKVLEDLALFKSSSMTWFFCMRDWRKDAGLDEAWIKTVHMKLKSMLFHLREYLLTDKLYRRRFILRCMYEDFSDTNQLIEKVRASKLPANTSIVARAVHLLNMMCLSFERLRVIREYRSPRSIRSFNKVFIFFLPTILSPYFVYLGKGENGKGENEWSPYYISVLVAFVFSALQGVQDKLDDPFDGMSEDDIDLATIDEWTFQSLEVTVHRIGRFQVLANIEGTDTIKARSFSTRSVKQPALEHPDGHSVKRKKGLSVLRRSMKRSETTVFEPGSHPYNDLLGKIEGNRTIRRGGQVRSIEESSEDSYIPPDDNTENNVFSSGESANSRTTVRSATTRLESLFSPVHTNLVLPVAGDDDEKRGVSFSDEPEIIGEEENSLLSSPESTNSLVVLLENEKPSSRFQLKTITGLVSSSTSSLPSPHLHTVENKDESLFNIKEKNQQEENKVNLFDMRKMQNDEGNQSDTGKASNQENDLALDVIEKGEGHSIINITVLSGDGGVHEEEISL